MAFKQNPDKKPRWEDLSKAALIKTVKTLSARQTKLLNQVTKLQDEIDVLKARPVVAALTFDREAGNQDAVELSTLDSKPQPNKRGPMDLFADGVKSMGTQFPWEK